MRLKRMASAAAIAASVGMAGLSIAVVPAQQQQGARATLYSVELAPGAAWVRLIVGSG